MIQYWTHRLKVHTVSWCCVVCVHGSLFITFEILSNSPVCLLSCLLLQLLVIATQRNNNMTSAAKIAFGSIRGYPVLAGTDKIQSKQFLEGSREIVTIIETFGKIFSPVVYDMNGNLQRLEMGYRSNEERFHYLDDMIICDSKPYVEPLLWLKRALELIHNFFDNIFNDKTCQENLKDHLKDAYHQTLRPYHGWIVQEAFNIIYRWVPYRSTLIGKDAEHEVNMKHLEMFLEPMKMHLDRINAIFTEHNLHQNDKV